MSTFKESSMARDGESLRNSRKVYVEGGLHPNIRVPFREINLARTKTMSGEIEVNEPVRVYDTSGPWGDPEFHGDVEQGLPPLRANWIRERGDVEEIEGRKVQPIDDGYLSVLHAEHSARRNGMTNDEFRMTNGSKGSGTSNVALRAKPGNAVTQLAYARRGIITPEMEFIAIREKGRGIENRESRIGQHDSRITNYESRDSLVHQHRGESIGENIPRTITPQFVRSVVARGRAIIPASINHP